MKVKKLITAICCIFAVLSHSSFAEGASLNNFKETKNYYDITFKDVKTSDWFSENVKKMYELGLMSGTSETIFEPQNDITIAEVITLASRISNIYYNENYQFDSTTPWYKSYVDYAVQKSIINNNQYTDYYAFATRAQFVDILAKALPENEFKKINNIELGEIPDVDTNAKYCGIVYSLYNAGIISGNDKYGTFLPNETIKRCEVAAIAARMVDSSLRKQFTLEEKTQTLYTEDGRSKAFKASEVEAQLTVGWYTEPVQRLYTTDGRSKVFKKSEVAAQLTVGWYTEKPSQQIATSQEKLRLKQEEINIKVAPVSNAGNMRLTFENMSELPYSISTVVVNGSISRSNEITVEPWKRVVASFTPMLSKPDALGMASYGYVVITWNGEQYYVEYDTEGITTFYKGNARGPID